MNAGLDPCKRSPLSYILGLVARGRSGPVITAPIGKHPRLRYLFTSEFSA